MHLVASRSRSPAVPGRPAQCRSWCRDVPIGQVVMRQTVSDELDGDKLCASCVQAVCNGWRDRINTMSGMGLTWLLPYIISNQPALRVARCESILFSPLP